MSVPEATFSALYEKYAPQVFRFAMHLCGNRAEAEDIASETFVRLWTRTEALEMETVKGYLLTIARNLFLQRLRKRQANAQLDDNVSSSNADPERELHGRTELRGVMAALQRLPEPDRAALAMRAFHDLPYEEIARVLGIGVGAAKVKVHRARLTLAGVGRSANERKEK